MRLIRFLDGNEIILAALTDDDKVYPLPQADFPELLNEANDKGWEILKVIEEVVGQTLPMDVDINNLSLLTPVDAPEVWAAGVTYEKSRNARNYEAAAGKIETMTVYDKVYDAPRPEIFFKSNSARIAGPNKEVYLRSDSNWQIPEPELGLVLNNAGEIVGYTIGNDMSCRDIEGENPLYLPQAKIWKNSCAIGPAIRLAETVENPYDFDIICRIYRDHQKVFEGAANTGQLKRRYEELVSYLLRDNEIYDGTVLLTGTCIVPPNEFSLKDSDYVEIEIPGIGVLKNSVRQPAAKSSLV